MEGETSESSSQVRSVMPCHGGKAEPEKRRKKAMAQQHLCLGYSGFGAADFLVSVPTIRTQSYA